MMNIENLSSEDVTKINKLVGELNDKRVSGADKIKSTVMLCACDRRTVTKNKREKQFFYCNFKKKFVKANCPLSCSDKLITSQEKQVAENAK